MPTEPAPTSSALTSDTPYPEDHRPWPTPVHPWYVWMSWQKLLFAHWPVDPDLVEPHVPDELTLQTREGAAWIGVVPFDMIIKGRAMPRFGRQSHFLELNVRTYVTHDDKPGVWFFSLEAERWLAVRAARALFHLPYFDADMALEEEGDGIVYRSERTHDGVEPARFEGRYEPTGEPYHAEDGSLEHFLTERYCLYAHDGVSLLRADVHHEPWPLQRAEVDIETNTMGDWLEIPLEGEPELAHFARRIDVVGWMPERV
jgi:uncharacterized protein YqjF (DUF2071 family)